MTRTAVLVFAVVLTAAAPSLTAQEPELRLDDEAAAAEADRRKASEEAEASKKAAEMAREIGFIEYYLDLERLRYGERLQATIDETVAAFGLKSSLAVADIWTDRFLPPAADRKLKA